MRTTILDIENHHIFDDAAKSFRSEGDDDNLCFGIQDWSTEDILKQREQTKGKLIAMQAELLIDNNARFNNQSYLEKLKQFDSVWDYSLHNIQELKEKGFQNVEYHPIVPNDKLKEAPLDKDIDVLHFGLMTRHRMEFINHAILAGYKIFDISTTYRRPIFGDELHKLIRRSRVVIGLHAYPTCPIQESFRYQYPLSNNITVIGERSLSNPLNIEEFSTKEEMVEVLMKHISPSCSTSPMIRPEFVDFESYLGDARNTTADNSRWIETAISFLEQDCAAANSTLSDRLFIRVFYGILELYPHASKNNLNKLHLIYKRLPVKHIRTLIESTTTKERLLLSNWSIFSTYATAKNIVYGNHKQH